MLWKTKISPSVCVCMSVCWIYWNSKKESEPILKESKNLGLEFSDFSSVARTWTVTDTGILSCCEWELLSEASLFLNSRMRYSRGTSEDLGFDFLLSSVHCLPCQKPGLLLTFNFIIGSCWQITLKWDQCRYVPHAMMQTEKSFQKLVSTADK